MLTLVYDVPGADDRDAATTAGERALVRAARNGDREAFAVLVGRHQNAVAAQAFALTGELTLSEDVAQESFLVAWRCLDQFDDAGRFGSWILGITRHRSLKAVRDRGKKVLGTPGSDLTGFPSPEPSPLDRVISVEEERFVWAALREIPEKYRITLVLFYREGKSLEKVAEVLDLSPTNVSVRLTRGRRMLHQQVTAMLESALSRSRPGKAFTVGVIAAVAALPAGGAAAGPDTGGASQRVRLQSAGKAAAVRAAVLLAVTALVAVGRWHRLGDPAGRAVSRSHPGVVGAAMGARASGVFASMVGGTPLQADAPGRGARPTRVVWSLASGEEEARPPLAFGHWTTCPPGMAGFCVLATADPPSLAAAFPWAITPLDPLHLPPTPGLVLSFDYWLGDADTGISMQFDVRREGGEAACCWNTRVPSPVHRTWGRAVIPVAEFTKHLKSGERLPASGFEEIHTLALHQIGAGNGGFYIANLLIGFADL